MKLNIIYTNIITKLMRHEKLMYGRRFKKITKITKCFTNKYMQMSHIYCTVLSKSKI